MNDKRTHGPAASGRATQAQPAGRKFWRSLEELSASEEVDRFLKETFPAAVLEPSFNRREFIKLMGASLALAGLTGCTEEPSETIVPYVETPELTPGKPFFFATAFVLNGLATGVLAESHMGRPTKIEGNPDHPASLGATDSWCQASVLTLYDPDRSQVVTHRGQISTWSQFLTAMSVELEQQRVHRGSGLRILTETVTSPTLASQLEAAMQVFPRARWHQYSPVSRDQVRAGAELAFGEDANPVYHLEKADVVLALDADFLTAMPGSLRYAREFMERRRARQGPATMNRLYVVENTPSLTGSAADHRLPMPAHRVEPFTRLVARELGVDVATRDSALSTEYGRWIRALADDLRRAGRSALVIPGEQQAPTVHALAHAINDRLNCAGRTVTYTDAVPARSEDQLASVKELSEDMEAGLVELLLILGGNPVYDTPIDLDFAGKLDHVKSRVHLGLYEDETAARCQWHIPQTHYLESWSDARAYDGTVSIIQPLIAPLYNGKSEHEVLAILTGQPGNSYEIVQSHWKDRRPSEDFELFWRKALHDGLVLGTELPPKEVEIKKKVPGPMATTAAESREESLILVFRPDPNLYDGRFANNGWLQELPRPLTKITWDNVALMSPRTAEALGLASEDLIELSYRGRKLRAPVWVQAGHADHSVTVSLGYGRLRAGRVGSGVGFDAYELRTSDDPWFGTGLKITGTGQRYSLATTQQHDRMEGRELIRVAPLETFRKNPRFAHEKHHAVPEDMTLYPKAAREGYAWGMAIDLTACIGCNACVVACQSENNIPIVGKDQVAVGREMHWLRIDRYYEGKKENPATHHQPVLCMHCENAPCEPVCPVGATVHSSEGLNDMVYNRCVGTRYCSNNCPYKVRRFNFFQYADFETPIRKLQRNPDVTVRSRGVMEKCTYCVQRINQGRIEAEKQDRSIRDGEILTACQQACPTQALVFGNIGDAKARVTELKASPLNYDLLGELNTRPRTSYLAKVTHPNPELENDGDDET